MTQPEALIEKYADACKRNAAEMANMPISVIRQHFKEFADEIAALALQPAGEGEAVAWQHRVKGRFDGAEWSAWESGRANYTSLDYEERPLYASPRPSAAEAGVREALVTLLRMGWEERDGEKLFTATAVFSDPPPWSADVIWKKAPFTLSLTAKREQTR